MRHAELKWDRVTPNRAWPLTPRGETQARSIVSRLLELDIRVVYSSPMERARATVAPFCSETGLVPRTETDLQEREVCWPPPPDEELVELFRKGWRDFDYKLPGFESNREAQLRFMATLREIVARHEGERVLVCAHGNVIALALHHIVGSIDEGELQIEYCGVRCLRVQRQRWRYEASFCALP